MATQEREPSTLKTRLLLKARERLSGRGKDEAQPLQRRKTTAGSPSGRHQPQQPESQRRASYQPTPVVFDHLPLRPRCLTPSPFESRLDQRLQSDAQNQSLLLTLPDEILLMIYKEIIGKQLIHIVRKRQKLGHSICHTTGNPDECREDQCRGFKLPTGTYAQTRKSNSDSIPLLQTCRTIYVDAIPLLYSSNVFDFDCMEGFLSMSCALLPQRFDSIRSVKMDFRFILSSFFSETTCFNDWPRWERTWRVLSTMESLQRLWVRISWSRDLFGSEEERMLEPLWILRQMKVFEVTVPTLKDTENDFRKHKEKEWGKEIPFQIVRYRRS